LVTLGDMIKVPGSKGSLQTARSKGADVRFVYSPLDCLKIATENPTKKVIFFAIGFETTTPMTAALVDAVIKKDVNEKISCETDISKHTVVPLAIPITVGPGTIGALMVMGAGMKDIYTLTIGSLALLCSIISVGILLYFSAPIKKILGSTGLIVLMKITGLIVAALSAQIIFTGIKNFLNL